MFVDGELEGGVVDDDCGDGDACLESWEKGRKTDSKGEKRRWLFALSSRFDCNHFIASGLTVSLSNSLVLPLLSFSRSVRLTFFKAK